MNFIIPFFAILVFGFDSKVKANYTWNERNDKVLSDSLKIDSTSINIVNAQQEKGHALRDSLKFERMKAVNPSFWDKINDTNLCTGMKASAQYRNGKIVKSKNN